MPNLPEKIKIACDKAQNAGECSYAKGCVIAQLGDLCGIDRSHWDRDSAEYRDYPKHKQILPYPTNLLDNLQDYWDNDAYDLSQDTNKTPNEMLLKYANKLNWPVEI